MTTITFKFFRAIRPAVVSDFEGTVLEFKENFIRTNQNLFPVKESVLALDDV